MQVYNIAINPELAQLELGEVKLLPTQHSKDRAKERKMSLPSVLVITKGSVVEVEAEGRRIKKVIVRFAIPNSDYDNVYVLYNQFGNLWNILSCYQNHRLDKHSTLNKKRLIS